MLDGNTEGRYQGKGEGIVKLLKTKIATSYIWTTGTYLHSNN
jgi:hypothetical protein